MAGSTKWMLKQMSRKEQKLARRLLAEARCPQCGDKVFAATIANPEGYPPNALDIGVICRDMGHWAGLLRECLGGQKE